MSSFEVIQKVPEGIRLPPPKNCPEEVINLMNSCWQLDPANRPSFDVITCFLNLFLIFFTFFVLNFYF